MKQIDIKRLYREKDEALVDKQKILDRVIAEKRGYNAEEQANIASLQNQIDRIDTQIREAKDIERQRMGEPAGQSGSALLSGELSPGVSGALPEKKARFFDVKTGKEVRSFAPGENWAQGREYQLPDGIRADELSLARLSRGLLTGDWKGAEAEQRTMSEGTGFLGGWAVPSPIADRIIQETRNQLRVLQAGALTIQMDSADLTLAKITADPTAHWVPENVAGTFSDMNFVPVKLTAKKLVAMTKMSEELVEDASNLEQVLTSALGFALAKELDLKALTGTGIGEPMGLLNTDGIGLVDLSSVSFTYDHFLDAIFSLVGQKVPIENIAALFNADVAKLLAKIKEATTNAYLLAPEAYQKIRKLLTAQVETAESDVSNVYLGDYRDLYIGLRRELSIAISKEASDDTDNAYTQSQVWFKTYSRVDCVAIRPSSFYIIKDGGVI